jgi:hypothetical protein
MSLFKGQSLLTLTVDTGYKDVASATVTKILYEKPNRKKGEFEAIVDGTKLSYDVQNGDIDVAGMWKFQAYIEVGGLKGYGDIVIYNFEYPLS